MSYVEPIALPQNLVQLAANANRITVLDTAIPWVVPLDEIWTVYQIWLQAEVTLYEPPKREETSDTTNTETVLFATEKEAIEKYPRETLHLTREEIPASSTSPLETKETKYTYKRDGSSLVTTAETKTTRVISAFPNVSAALTFEISNAQGVLWSDTLQPNLIMPPAPGIFEVPYMGFLFSNFADFLNPFQVTGSDKLRLQAQLTMPLQVPSEPLFAPSNGNTPSVLNLIYNKRQKEG